MSRATPVQTAEPTVAVLHRVAGAVCALAATATPRPRVVAARRFENDDPDPIEAWLTEHHATEVMGVLPAAAVICRTSSLPDAEPAQLEQALRLQAEAYMLGSVPPHRQAMAVLPSIEGETDRSGIIVAWPEKAAPAFPALRHELTFTPDVAALAALLNGERPAEPLLWIDRTDGSVALAISHTNGAVFRAARGNPESLAAWGESLGRLIAETALSVGHSGAFTESLVEDVTNRLADAEAAALLAPSEIIKSARARIEGTPADPGWWRDHGVAVGAILARVEGLDALTRLREAPPLQSPSGFRRVVEALSQPATAAKLAALALAVVFLAPIVASGLRLWLLQVRLTDLPEYVTEARAARSKLVMYRELKENAWPMSKLLADIACNTPQGIELDQVRVKYGERLLLSGRAKRHGPDSAQEIVALMQENFRQSMIFNEIYYTWGEPDTFGQYDFTLSARVVRPYHRHRYPLELDFGEWTLGDRLYKKTGPPEQGQQEEPAEAPDPPPPPPPAAAEAIGLETADADADGDGETDALAMGRGIVRLPADRPSPLGAAAESRANDRGLGGGPPPASQDIPEALTEEQIELMTLDDAQESRARVAKARQRGILDKETRERLRKEFRLLTSRIRKLQKDR